MTRSLLLFAGTILSGISCSSQNNFGESVEMICQEHQLMGLSVITLCGGIIEDEVYWGYRDLERELPVDENTQYRIASVSKFVTATGLMKLKETHGFSLDVDISTFLGYEIRNPLYPDNEITLRMLLTHTSSLQDAPAYSSFLSATYSNNPVPSIEELIDPVGIYFESNIWRTEEPGTYFVYSNLNFGLIATVMEAISGQRFDELMKQTVLEPLDMEGSYNVQDLEDINNLAVLYRYQGGWVPQADNYQGIYPEPLELTDYIPGTNGLLFGPQGGLRCSARDLSNLLVMHGSIGFHNNTPFLAMETISEMHAAAWTFNGNNGDNYYGLFREWGLGVHRTTNTPNADIVFADEYSDELVIGHPGEAYGLISDFYFTSYGSGIILLINGAQNGYEFAENSAYYQVESEIFEAASIFSGLPVCPMNINENSGELSIDLFPNPASKELWVNVPPGSINCCVYSNEGRKLIQESCSEQGETLIDVSALSPGYYILSITNSHGVLTRVFNIQR